MRGLACSKTHRINMSLSYYFVSLVTGSTIILILPGPTNTLLFSAGITLGVRRTLPLVAAEALGYIAAISLWGFALLPAAGSSSWLLPIVKMICAFYIGFLALKMWSQRSFAQKPENKLLGPADLFLATLSNPKALIFVAAIFPVDTFDSSRSFILVIACFTAILLPIGIAWSYFGSLTSGSTSAYVPHYTLLKIASGVLMLFAVSMIYSALKG